MIKDIVDSMISNSLEHRMEHKDKQKYLHESQYAVEYKTIVYGSARQTGKTSYIIDFIKNTRDSVTVILPTMAMVDYFISELRRNAIYRNNVFVYTANTAIRYRRHDYQPSTWVFLDECLDCYHRNERFQFYENFNDYDNSLQTFIFLGTL